MKAVFLVCAVAAVFGARAELWRGLEDANHYSGPKITEADLAGKVVLVDCWGINCPPCRALLPRMEEIWSSFKTKPFVLLGSHCQGKDEAAVKELVTKNKLTYPVYQFAGSVNAPNFSGLPFMYVVNHRGKVVYAGSSERDATEALVTAIGYVGMPPDIVPGVAFRKYKALEKKFRLGNSIKSDVKKLQKDVKQFAKAKAPIQIQQREEAEAILAALKTGMADVQDEIKALMTTDPEKALKFIKQFQVTFPEEGKAYDGEIPALKEKVAELKAAKAKK